NAADRLLIVEFDRKQGADGSLTVDVQARSFGILDGVESEATDTCAECAEDKLGEVTQKTVASLLGIEFKAPPEPARLAITTTPPAATVSIDGREVGQSGTVHEVEPGWRTVEARLDGHKPAQSRVEAKEGETLPVNLDLEVEKPAGTGNDGNGAKTGNGQNGNSNGTQQPSVPADDSSWGTLKTLVVGAGATGVVVGLGYLGINGRTWGLENEEYRTWDEGLLIGGIGLAVAVGGYLLLPNKNSSEPTSGVSLRVSGDGIGVGYSGRF
ncbi:MAG: PEGA domain-containing protein, partial [Myxococcota bacterium]